MFWDCDCCEKDCCEGADGEVDVEAWMAGEREGREVEGGNLHQRQETWSVKAPPSSGPMTIPSCPTNSKSVCARQRGLGTTHRPSPAQYTLPRRQQYPRPRAQHHSLGRTPGAHAPSIIVSVPFVSPEAPSPAIARPMMSTVEEEDAPQIAEPASNSARKTRYVHYLDGQFAGCSRKSWPVYLDVEVGEELPRERLDGGAIRRV